MIELNGKEGFMKENPNDLVVVIVEHSLDPFGVKFKIDTLSSLGFVPS